MADGEVRIALTADDAPTIAAAPGGVRADPARLDHLREVLLDRGIEHCVAFVIGATARGHEAALERWLDAGFELGNHTHEHLAASQVDPVAYLASVRRCDALLRAIGAFSQGATRWFRHPYLDRGADPVARALIAHSLGDLGYDVAHATIDFFDHAYEAPWARALGSGSARGTAAVGARFENTALASLRQARRVAWRRTGRDVPHIAYFHFGGICERHLGPLLDRCRDSGVRWCSVREALEDPLYREYDCDPGRTGLVLAQLDRSTVSRIAGRLSRLADRLDPRRETVGPRFPHRH